MRTDREKPLTEPFGRSRDSVRYGNTDADPDCRTRDAYSIT